jgi:hypothetical protein
VGCLGHPAVLLYESVGSGLTSVCAIKANALLHRDNGFMNQTLQRTKSRRIAQILIKPLIL